ncbi:hypothetical protein CAPTEDRAFT_180954 [Capitella teleta]|uniref:CAP-Gly domain-containing protein n=1 Tax=Capitella teleta TaxID=283909 RepID=R7UM96_CAPTE|nr:hypothetical protein CAPTEDRAFT_180954 [Capitella teleta]|eukprot:ELU07644.1 hypothetical protein CAPTEDRAFT_180954 [Capitella teleta]
MSEYTVISNPILSIKVSSSISSFVSEKRYQKDLTIAALKGKLELITGASAASMKLEVYNNDDKLVCVLNDNEALLGSYQIDDGMRIHAVDTVGKVGEFEDLSKVEKFELAEDEYAKRTDSVRAFKERMKMGQFREVDPEEQKRIDEEKQRKKDEEAKKAASLTIGSRCEVRVEKQPIKRGTIKYVGETDFKPGLWVGVQYDEPMGKNDGSVKGRRYFECPAKYGGFIKPSQVTAGDFPELGLEDDDLEM